MDSGQCAPFRPLGKTTTVHLTRDQFRIAETLGCSFQPAAAEQIARLSMQRRVFWLDNQAYLALRGDGFYETAATLSRLLQEAEAARPARPAFVAAPPAPPVEEPAPSEEPTPAAAAAPPETQPEAEPEAPAAPAAKAPQRRRKAVAAPPEPEPEPEPEAAPAVPVAGDILEATSGEDLPAEAAAEPAGADAPDLPAAEVLALPPVAAAVILPLSARAATAGLVAAYVASTPVAATELPELIRGIHRSVLTLSRR